MIITLNDFINRNLITEKTYNVLKGINNTNINATYGDISDDGIGAFYTDNVTMAKWFAGLTKYDVDVDAYVDKENDGKVTSNNITLNNPYIINSSDEDYDSVQVYFDEIKNIGDVQKYKANLIKQGYDGIILKNCNTNYYEENTYNVYIAFIFESFYKFSEVNKLLDAY